MRRLSFSATIVVLACAAGCASVQLREHLAHAHGTPIIEIDDPSFDGEHLTGRLLIGTDDAGYVVVDRRLVAHAHIVVDRVVDCDGGAKVDWIAADSVIKSPRQEDYQTVEPGYWYGANFRLLVYDEVGARTPVPACIQVFGAVNFEATAPGAERPKFIVQAHLTRPAAGANAGQDAGVELPDAGSQ